MNSQLKSPVANVSAVGVSENIGVYWDAGCRNRVNSIDWGVLSLGKSKDVIVYVLNKVNETIFLSMVTSNFLPASAADYLSPTFSCRGHKIKANHSVEVALSLLVSPGEKSNSTFSFDLVFEGKKYMLGDLNGDGKVDMFDAAILGLAFGLTPLDKRWNPDADMNEDGTVDISDVVLFGLQFGAG